MYFLENDRRYCRTYSNLEASVQKELSFFQQKAKEWAEVRGPSVRHVNNPRRRLHLCVDHH